MNNKIVMQKRAFVLFLPLLTLAACASTPIEVAPDALIFNRSQKQIRTISYRTCDSTDAAWMAIEGTAVAGGGVLRLALPAECVDLQAQAADGKIIGTQTGVKRQFPFRWQLY